MIRIASCALIVLLPSLALANRPPPRDTRPPAIPGDAPPVPGMERRPSQPPAIPGDAPPPREQQRCPPGERCYPDYPPERRAAGFFIGANAGLTGLHRALATTYDFEAGFHLQGRFTLSAAAGRAVDYSGRGGLTWFGVRPGLVITPEQPVLVQADVLLGVGAETSPISRSPYPLINVVEPRLSVGLPLERWGQLSVYGGVRTVPPWQPAASALTAPTFGITYRMGWF